MANYNRTIISGNLGNDPKVADDSSWTHASIATSNSFSATGNIPHKAAVVRDKKKPNT